MLCTRKSNKNQIIEVKKKIATHGLSEETKDFLKESDRRFKLIQETTGYKMYRQRVSDFNHRYFKDIIVSGDEAQNSG